MKQARSDFFFVLQETYAKFGLDGGYMKFNTKSAE
jgi:hypothetical protein